MYPTPNELSSYSPAWPCAHFRLAGGVNALAGVLFIYLVNLPLLTILRIVSVYQLVHIFMAPGIEPGNLIRSTLIRSPPGPFFKKNLTVIWFQA